MIAHRSRTATLRSRRLSAAVVLGLLTLTGCAPAGDASGHALPEAWTPFGPFEKPAEFAGDDDLPGPELIRLPDGDAAYLDASELLGSGVKLLARDDYRVTAESYLYTRDADEPLIVGLVQTIRTMHYRGYTEDEHNTFVLGISAEETPREVTRTRVLRGGAHSASFAGSSDLGVVAVLLEGALNTDAPDDSRVIGVDAVRGTEVWVKEHGYPAYGDGIARFYVSPTPDSCASAVVTYDVANGVVVQERGFANTDPDTGGVCETAAEAG